MKPNKPTKGKGNTLNQTEEEMKQDIGLFIGLIIGLLVNKALFGYEIMVGTALLIILYLLLRK